MIIAGGWCVAKKKKHTYLYRYRGHHLPWRKKKGKKEKGKKNTVPSTELANFDWIVSWFYLQATPAWTSQEHSRYLSVPHRTPPPPFRCSCQRCKKVKQSPKLFPSDNNMDSGSVPVQQQMHDRINCKKRPTGSLPPAVPLAITPTFSPWTHTSDDSYIYQLSLVVATATLSLIIVLRSRIIVGVSKNLNQKHKY